MSISAPPDPFVILYGIPWEQYGNILEALGRYQLRHTYVKGTLEMRGLLYGVAWSDYKAFLEALGDYSLRHTYAKGTLEMMAPRKDHDWVKRGVGRMIETLAFVLDIDIQSIGSTTLTSDPLERGFQPDEAYYVANEPLVRGKFTYEPDVDPPPDLVVEIDVTSSSLPRLPGFAAIGIPEVWRSQHEQVEFLRLTQQGEYEPMERSLAFPFLFSADVNACLADFPQMSENAAIRKFAALVQAKVNQPPTN